jgi:hypothetical protein
VHGSKPDLSQWWSDDDFEECPKCGERKLAPPTALLSEANVRVCVVCGLVTAPSETVGEPHPNHLFGQ